MSDRHQSLSFTIILAFATVVLTGVFLIILFQLKRPPQTSLTNPSVATMSNRGMYPYRLDVRSTTGWIAYRVSTGQSGIVAQGMLSIPASPLATIWSCRGANNLSCAGALTSIVCPGNELTAIDITHQDKLRVLSCPGNQIGILALEDLPELQSINCSINALTSLSLKRLPALQTLCCSSNKLKCIDLIDLPSLKSIICSNNQITTLHITDTKALTEVGCESNELSVLDASGLSSLKFLNCSHNHITDLRLGGCSSLWSVLCYNNPLTGSVSMLNQFYNALPYLPPGSHFLNIGTDAPLGDCPALYSQKHWTVKRSEM